MEYLAGETLRDRLARGRLPLKQAIRYGTDIAAALAAAHRAGVVHRDLKPASVMLTESGAMLLDFGIARLPEAVETRTSAPVGSITIAGTLLGTLPYMAPEQVEGRLTNTLTDIFAFGAVMYEMVSGRRAFPGETDASIAAAILTTHPNPASPRSTPTFPRSSIIWLRSALRKNRRRDGSRRRIPSPSWNG